MAEWERHEEQYILRRVTYVIPPGAGWDAIQRVLNQAMAEWRELAGLDRDAEVPPEAVTWKGLGQHMQVCIQAEIEESTAEAKPEQGGDQPVEAPDAGEGKDRA